MTASQSQHYSGRHKGKDNRGTPGKDIWNIWRGKCGQKKLQVMEMAVQDRAGWR